MFFKTTSVSSSLKNYRSIWNNRDTLLLKSFTKVEVMMISMCTSSAMEWCSLFGSRKTRTTAKT